MKKLLYSILMMFGVTASAMNSMDDQLDWSDSFILSNYNDDIFCISPELARESGLLKIYIEQNLDMLRTKFETSVLEMIVDMFRIKFEFGTRWKEELERVFKNSNIFQDANFFGKSLLALNYLESNEIIEFLVNYFAKLQKIKNEDDIVNYFNKATDLDDGYKHQSKSIALKYFKPEIDNRIVKVRKVKRVIFSDDEEVEPGIMQSKKRKIGTVSSSADVNPRPINDLKSLMSENKPYGNFELDPEFLLKRLCEACQKNNDEEVKIIIKYFPLNKEFLLEKLSNAHAVNDRNLIKAIVTYFTTPPN